MFLLLTAKLFRSWTAFLVYIRRTEEFLFVYYYMNVASTMVRNVLADCCYCRFIQIKCLELELKQPMLIPNLFLHIRFNIIRYVWVYFILYTYSTLPTFIILVIYSKTANGAITMKDLYTFYITPAKKEQKKNIKKKIAIHLYLK